MFSFAIKILSEKMKSNNILFFSQVGFSIKVEKGQVVSQIDMVGRLTLICVIMGSQAYTQNFQQASKVFA
jgi:hypothetical protein